MRHLQGLSQELSSELRHNKVTDITWRARAHTHTQLMQIHQDPFRTRTYVFKKHWKEHQQLP